MSENKEPFFVGYLPMPGALRRLHRVVVVALLSCTILCAFVLAALQRDPGPAVWIADQESSLTGILRVHPYPHIQHANPAHGGATLLVGQGKRGSDQQVRAFDGQTVQLHGHLLRRDDLQMLELTRMQLADVADPAGSAPPPADSARLQVVTLRGEIVDSKCFLGAMKPGDGKSHKACATLCIRGGIPPLLVTWDEAGGHRCYLLTDLDGRALAGESLNALLPFVGEPVEVTGHPEQATGFDTLRVGPAGIHRR
jgi:hypothetical protein